MVQFQLVICRAFSASLKSKPCLRNPTLLYVFLPGLCLIAYLRASLIMPLLHQPGRLLHSHHQLPPVSPGAILMKNILTPFRSDLISGTWVPVIQLLRTPQMVASPMRNKNNRYVEKIIIE